MSRRIVSLWLPHLPIERLRRQRGRRSKPSRVAFALSEGSEQRAPMGQAVIGGVITSSLLTLVVVPVVYCYLDDLARWLRRGRARPGAGSGAEPVPASKMGGLS